MLLHRLLVWTNCELPIVFIFEEFVKAVESDVDVVEDEERDEERQLCTLLTVLHDFNCFRILK